MKSKLVAIVAMLFTAVAFAQDKKAPQVTGVAAGEVTRVEATVDAIDQASRVVTLKYKNGNSYTFVAGPDVKNLAQVKKGDVVVMEYIEAVALSVKKTASTVRDRTETEFKKSADPGQQPGGIVGRHIKITASVEAVDAKAGKVTLRGPQRTVDLKVKDPANLKDVKTGDMVEAEFLEAFAIKVEPAPPKK